jgi:N-acylneuraminate cytidylyltransferase
MILPTAPFVGAKIIAETFAGIAGGGYDSLFPVVRFSYPIYRALDFEDGKVSMIWPENMNKRSQDLKPAFHDAGQFYWINVKSFKEQKKVFMANSSAVELPETLVQDIDSEVDWKIAEIKYKTFIGVSEDEK